MRRMAGDVAAELRAADTEELPVHARAYLASDRPWRAARVMRRYREENEDVSDDLRVLAARAEAGWGAWQRVHALLRDVRSLDTYDHGIGLYLLGRARDAAGDAAGATAAYASFLTLPLTKETAAERGPARLRLALALIAAGQRDSAAAELRAISNQLGDGAVWVDLLAADALAARGDTMAVREISARHTEGVAGLHAWRARIEAATRAKDADAARALAVQARKWAQTKSTRAEFLVAEGRTALALGDDAGAREALRAAIAHGSGGAAARAAAELLQHDSMAPDDHLAIARVQSAQGYHAESIAGYRRWLDARIGTAAERAEVHMEHANALFYAGRYDDVAAALRPVMRQTSARMLHARAEAHAGRPKAAIRIYLELAGQYARTGVGAQALFLAAGTHHDEWQVDRARSIYQRVVREYPGTTQMALAMMRLAAIAFVEKEYAEAAGSWDEYRTRYPRGRHVLEAMYWSARARAQAGDSVAAATLFREVRERQRDSYYALKASEHLGQPFWPLPMSASPRETGRATQMVNTWMAAIDLLRDAGFPDHASAEADRIVAAAGRDTATLYALAEALAERGYSRRAIGIGMRLQKGPPNQRLLRILFPFPYRTLITEEARARDLDPFIAAALIRQESMFEARITSLAGARGLMQIMPATGSKLAAAVGLKEWHPAVLYQPEINVHLGTRYLTQHMHNYDGSLPSVFSAYNAGAHRVKWWSEFPEYEDEELFTERIPYAETRGYVKILTRNRALYAGLYGD